MEHLIRAEDLSIERNTSTLMEEQGNPRHADCAVEMMNECVGSQNMKNMKLNDDQNMNNERFDDVTVTPSVSISSPNDFLRCRREP